jgi:hypothetical protein
LAGFLDRIVLEWAGPEWFLQKRTMQIAKSVYAGDTLIGTGKVVGKRVSDGNVLTLDVELAASNQCDELCVVGRATITCSKPIRTARREPMTSSLIEVEIPG